MPDSRRWWLITFIVLGAASAAGAALAYWRGGGLAPAVQLLVFGSILANTVFALLVTRARKRRSLR